MKGQLKKQDFLSLFRKEAEGHILELNKGLLELENNPQNRAVLEEVRRRAHTLKGSAKMMGFTEVSNASHAMEDLLESVRMELTELDKSVFDRLFQSLDSINALLQAGEGEKKIEEDRETPAYAGAEAESSKPQRVESVIQDAILVKTDKLDSLAGVFSEMVLDQIKSENQTTEVSLVANVMREQVKLWSSVKEKICRMMEGKGGNGEKTRRHGGTEKEGGRREGKEGDGEKTRRHGGTEKEGDWEQDLQMEEINRYDNLSISILDNMIDLLDEYRAITAHRRLMIDQLQEHIRSIRLVPVSVLFDTFPRAVRDLGREYNKEIKLSVSGGEVELDKSIIETIKDPLMHLVRNAVDHGIEEPEERLRRGKPKTGDISLSAYHRGNKVVIEVSDDGAGIDTEKVKQVALKKGYIRESQLGTMDKDSAISLIFIPGLSTSSIITDVSGRGVGMDVVMENVGRKLKGLVSVHTEAGRGTTVSLVVPITLAIMRGLLVKVGQGIFAVPTESVKRSVKVSRDDIKSVEGKQVITEDGRIIPLARLSEVLGVAPSAPSSGNIPVVIIDYAQKQIGFYVDGFVGEQEMVIKNLGSYLKRVPNVAGVTVLGSGEVVIILHVSDLMSSAVNKIATAFPAQQKGPPVVEKEVVKTPSILIVDDSLTTRELERSILEASGYDVQVAVDGLDGLTKVAERKFDLIISDVQMPRMDGFQMMEMLKQNEHYKDIPVILVTALQKDEEKRRGIEVGASAYIVKSSFDQLTLIDTIQMLIGS